MLQHGSNTILLLVICCLGSIFLVRPRLLPPLDDAILLSAQSLEGQSQAKIANLKAELDRKEILIDKSNKQVEDLLKQNKALKRKLESCETKLKSNATSVGEAISESRERFENEMAREAAEENLTDGSKGELGASALDAIRHPVCRLLSQKSSFSNESARDFVVPSTLFAWTKLLKDIHNASDLLPQDPEYCFHDFTAHLLQLVSSRLPQTSRNLPRSWEALQNILDIGWKRYKYFLKYPEALQKPEPGQPPKLSQNYSDLENIPPPVNILIMGGSLLQGTNCRKMVRDLKVPIGLALIECSWGHRLGAFLNQVFQMPLVKVTNIGMGGTNTATAALLLQHELLPKTVHSPDIIINGYSTNDMHAFTVNEAQHSNTTLGDQIRTMMENFYRNATKLGQKGCSTNYEPLIIHFDDYIGNEQREILATMEGSFAVQSLSKYYGFSSISYTDLVRDWVYGDTRETWFSPEGWYTKEDDKTMIREIHPQLGMHIVAAWVVAYNMLDMVTTFCSVQPWQIPGLEGRQDTLLQSYETTRLYLPQLPSLRGDTKYVPPGKPRSPPLGLPPRLTKTLSLEEISELWKNETDNQRDRSVSSCGEGESFNRTKCPFAWVSRVPVLPIPGVPKTEKGDYLAYWEAHAVGSFSNSKSRSWDFQKDHAKIGICPMNGIGSEIVLEIPSQATSQPTDETYSLADSVTIFYMKSYGERWENSTIKLDILSKPANESGFISNWTTISSVRLSGYHAKNTSETYTETIKLSSDFLIQQLRVAITLINGETFKIMGLLVCHLGMHD